MAGVTSVVRSIVKPVVKAVLGPRVYDWLHVQAKLRDIRHDLVHEPEMDVLGWFVKDGDEVLDIGANFAYYTWRLSALCGPKGKVHAFEPIPWTFQLLERIVRKLKLANVVLHQKGVGETTSEMSFDVPLQEAGTPSAGQAHFSGRNNDLPGKETHHRFQRHQRVVCPVVSLDDSSWLGAFGKISFVKMDIEGAELFALKGMRKLLARDQPVVQLEACPFFLQGFGLTEHDLRKEIEGLGYGIYRFDSQSKLLRPLADSAMAEANYLLIPLSRTREFRQRMGSGSVPA